MKNFINVILSLRSFFTVFLALLFSFHLFSAEWLSLKPLDNKHLLLHISDGEVYFHTSPATAGQDTYLKDTLDLQAAGLLLNYSLSSVNDPNYIGGKLPLSIGRKAKTGPFPDIWPDYPYILQHWISIELPDPLQTGKTYTLQLNGLTSNTSSISFTFNETAQRSEALHINQIGFTPESPAKYAYLYFYTGDRGALDYTSWEGQPFHIINADGSNNMAFSGTVSFRAPLQSETNQGEVSYYGSPVWECNFSGFQTPGEYRVVIPGIGCSYDFKITEDVYREAFYTSVRGLYHQRSGTARGLPYSEYEKPEDHIPGLNGHKVYYSAFRFMDALDQDDIFVQLPAQVTTTEMPQAFGGWMDAADYDKYASHLIIVNDLCLVYEMAPCHFKDNELNLPESGNGIPDILDEARFEVDFFLRLKGPTGGISGGLETSDHPGASTSWTDPLKTWYQYGEDPLTSYWLAASAAQLAYCLDMAGFPELRMYYLNEAIAAFTWAQNNLQPGDLAKKNCFGRQMQAAAWLFKVTGNQEYLLQYESECPILESTTPLDIAEGNFEHAVWAYVTADKPGRSPQFLAKQRGAVIYWADEMVLEPATNRACRMGFGRWLPNIIGLGSTTPLVMPAIVAHYITGEEKYRTAAQTSADYYLGGNPLNTVWVTGLGDNPVEFVAHVESWYDDKPGSVPGITPYGMVGPDFVGGTGFWGSWAAGYNALSYYPGYWGYASHELFTENRYCWIANEFTIWQNIGPTAAAYAYLCADICDVSAVNGADVRNDWNIEIVPNPFSSNFTLHYTATELVEPLQIRVFTLDGRLILSDRTVYPGAHFGDDLPQGVFIVEVVGNQKVTRQIVLKQ